MLSAASNQGEAIAATARLVLPWGDTDDRLHSAVAAADVCGPVPRTRRLRHGRPAAVAAKVRELAGHGRIKKEVIAELNAGAIHPDVLVNEVFEACVEDHLQGPVFVIDYPAAICPLTKRKASNPAIAERFELFIHGMELANAYTELNDPSLQEELFRTQLAGLAEEDSMAKMDHDFVQALKVRHAAGGGAGNRHRPAGDAADQQPLDPRRDLLPAAAAGAGAVSVRYIARRRRASRPKPPDGKCSPRGSRD